MEEIENTISELENQSTTFANCEKLANLYIVRDHFATNPVIEEYKDILPSYSTFCETKRRYQMGEIDEQPVLNDMNKLCIEIQEFLLTLYNNTDMKEERNCIKESLHKIYSTMN
jgi:hypothetical protein